MTDATLKNKCAKRELKEGKLYTLKIEQVYGSPRFLTDILSIAGGEVILDNCLYLGIRQEPPSGLRDCHTFLYNNPHCRDGKNRGKIDLEFSNPEDIHRIFSPCKISLNEEETNVTLHYAEGRYIIHGRERIKPHPPENVALFTDAVTLLMQKVINPSAVEADFDYNRFLELILEYSEILPTDVRGFSLKEKY